MARRKESSRRPADTIVRSFEHRYELRVRGDVLVLALNTNVAPERKRFRVVAVFSDKADLRRLVGGLLRVVGDEGA